MKIYAAKSLTNTTGEVRINDAEIHELSAIVRQMAEKWDMEQFASEKQFIFIEQSADTYTPPLYDGAEGFSRMRSVVAEYLKLFQAADTQELYENLYDETVKKNGDATLAGECCCLLAEIAAMNAINEAIKVSDTVVFRRNDGRETTACLSQLSDFDMLCGCLIDIINKRDFGEGTKQLWQDLIGCSSICHVLNEADKAGSKLENLGLLHMTFIVNDEFELR